MLRLKLYVYALCFFATPFLRAAMSNPFADAIGNTDVVMNWTTASGEDTAVTVYSCSNPPSSCGSALGTGRDGSFVTQHSMSLAFAIGHPLTPNTVYRLVCASSDPFGSPDSPDGTTWGSNAWYFTTTNPNPQICNPTVTPTVTPSFTRTRTPDFTPSRTDTRTLTATRTPTPTISRSPTFTKTASPTRSPTVTPTPTVTRTNTQTVTPTVTLTATP